MGFTLIRTNGDDDFYTKYICPIKAQIGAVQFRGGNYLFSLVPLHMYILYVVYL